MSAPVVSTNDHERTAVHTDHTGPHDSFSNVVGFIDVRDILASFLQEIDIETVRDAKMLKRMRILEEYGSEFALKPIRDLKALGADGWFYALKGAQHSSLRDIIYDGFLYPKESKSLFGGTRSRQVVHRLALFDADGGLTNVISQSDMISFLYKHLNDIGILASATVSNLGFVRGQEGVLSVRPDTPALDAMVLMEDRNISAVAVVNSSGSIIANFSISELRTIMAEHFGSLALPVGEFLALEHGTEYAGYAAQKDYSNSEMGDSASPMSASSPRPSSASFAFVQNREMRRRDSTPGSEVGQTLITCTPQSTLAEVLEKLVHNRLHRVYICNDEFVPCGVITLTDILRKLVGTATD